MKRFTNEQLFSRPASKPASKPAVQPVKPDERKQRIFQLTEVLVSVAAAIRAYNDGRFDHGTDLCEEAAGQLHAVFTAE